MTPVAEAFKKERPDRKEYWQNEMIILVKCGHKKILSKIGGWKECI
ncbi:MAG TPA: hypothetical protein VHF65_09450 [Nitrososphaera sp.]|jgi:hypothetical protein|nr:hypothetical protein [Nitrososphaera sp.]